MWEKIHFMNLRCLKIIIQKINQKSRCNLQKIQIKIRTLDQPKKQEITKKIKQNQKIIGN